MVQGQDLFAREANLLQSCRKLFNMQYINHLNEKEGLVDKEQDGMTFAYHKALTVALDFIQDRVTRHNEVVHFTSLRFLDIQELERSGYPSRITEVRNLRLDLKPLY